MDYTNYTTPRGPKTEADMIYIVRRIADTIHYRKLNTTDYVVTTEDIIEIFRGMNDDYDDWYARGLTTKGAEYKFVYDLISRLNRYGISNIKDNTFV